MRQVLKFWFAGMLIGIGAWSFHIALLPLVLFLFYLWPQCEKRIQAFALWCGFYMGTVNGIPLATVEFFGMEPVKSLPLGVAFWIIQAALLALPWTIFLIPKATSPAQKCWRFLAAILLSIVPPLGLLGWGHPIAVAGIIFPGLEWWGLLACLVVFFCLCVHDLRHRKWIIGAACLLGVLSNIFYASPPLPENWVAQNTHFGMAPDSPTDRFTRHLAMQELAAEQFAHGKTVVIFPENVAGKWSAIETQLWMNWLNDSGYADRSVWIGGHIPSGNGRFHNSMIQLTGKDASMYHARLSMPIGNYNPFSPASSTLSPMDDGLVSQDGKRAAVFVCYEGVVSWPLLLSMAARPDIIILASNTWWANKTTLPRAMEIHFTSWARLFHLPVLHASNR